MKRLSLLLLALLSIAACGSEETSDATTDESPPATAPAQDGPVIADPALVKAGERIDLRFPSEVHRGVCWYLSERDGSGWSEPVYFLVSGPPGHDNTRAPSWHPREEDWECEDVGVSGPGPDPIVVPDTASGPHRLCTANTGDETYCTTIQIETDDEPTRVVTVNPGDTSGCVQMINIDTGENYFFTFDPINGSSPAYDTQSCNDIHIPGDTFHIPIPDNVPDGTYRFCLQDCQTIRVG